MRTGSMPSSPHSQSHHTLLSSVRSGGVQKSTAINRRPSGGPAIGSRRPGQLRVAIPPRRRRSEYFISDDEEDIDMDVADATPMSAYPRTTSITVRPSPRRSSSRPTRCPGAIASPRNSMTLGGMPSISSLSMLPMPHYWTWNAPGSPTTPQANLVAPPLTAEDIAEYDSVDLNMVLSHLADEPVSSIFMSLYYRNLLETWARKYLSFCSAATEAIYNYSINI